MQSVCGGRSVNVECQKVSLILSQCQLAPCFLGPYSYVLWETVGGDGRCMYCMLPKTVGDLFSTAGLISESREIFLYFFLIDIHYYQRRLLR